MSQKRAFTIVGLAGVLLGCWSLAGRASGADQITIRVHLLQAALPEGRPGPNQVEVLTTSSRPELAVLKDKAQGPSAELTAALIDALLEIYDLDAVNDLFRIEKEWNGLGRPYLEESVLGGPGPFRIRLRPKRLGPQQISLELDISTGSVSPSGAVELAGVIHAELNLMLDDPVIVAAPAADGLYTVLVMATIGKPAAGKPGADKENAQEIELVPAPKPVKQVRPSYPEALRLRGVGGEVGLQITIDGKGNVARVDVIKPIHPYLNYAAVQAFKQWAFEPVLRKGKPRTARFRCGYNYDPSSFVPAAAPEAEPSAAIDPLRQKELPEVLEKCGKYCQTLADAVLDFVCQETIKETHYGLLKDLKWAYLVVGPSHKVGATRYVDRSSLVRPSDQLQFQEAAAEGSGSDLIEDRGQFKPKVTPFLVMDPKQTQRNSFICDYQIVRKAGKAEDRRILLKQNGRAVGDQKRTLDEKRFSGLGALFAPLRVIALGSQDRFSYALAGDDKVHGNRATVIRAVPRSGDEDGIWSARIWVDAKTYRVLRCEIEGVPIDGYEDVLNDCARLNIRPSFIVTHEYKAEKKGVLFPERSTVRVGYPGIDPQGAIPKIVATLSYGKYRYFTVETDNAIIR